MKYFSLIILMFLTSVSAFGMEEILHLAADTGKITEAVPQVQITNLNIDSEVATFWFERSMLENELEELYGDFIFIDCGSLGSMVGPNTGTGLESSSKLILLVAGREADSQSGLTDKDTKKKRFDFDLKDDSEISIEEFGRVFKGKTKDGKEVYGIVSDTFGEYKLENGDGTAAGIVSKEGTKEINSHIYLRGKVEAGAIVFYDKLLGKTEQEDMLQDADMSELLKAHLGSEAGAGVKNKLGDGELSFEIYTHFDNSKEKKLGLKHEYDVIRTQYKDELTKELALVSGIAATKYKEIGTVYSAYTGFESDNHKLSIVLSDKAIDQDRIYGATLSTTYERKISDNFEISLSGKLPLEGDHDSVIAFSIKKKF